MHVCLVQTSSAFLQLYSALLYSYNTYLLHIYADSAAALYELLYTGLLDSSCQAYIGLMSQPESLNLHNKISLPFKYCQIPLEYNQHGHTTMEVDLP